MSKTSSNSSSIYLQFLYFFSAINSPLYLSGKCLRFSIVNASNEEKDRKKFRIFPLKKKFGFPMDKRINPMNSLRSQESIEKKERQIKTLEKQKKKKPENLERSPEGKKLPRAKNETA